MKHSHTRSRKAALALSLTAVLALSACGDDTGDSPEASATPTRDRTVCPTTATEIPAYAGVVEANKDLAVKPKIAKGPATAPTSVSYFDIVEGSGDVVKTGSYVKMKYVGALYADGKEFDSSWKTSATTTIDIQTCYQGTVTGFSIAPTGMKAGGRREVIIPAAFGYGEAGQPPDIGKNATLIFIIDLVAASVTPFPVDPVPTPTATVAPTVVPTAVPTVAPTGSAPAATTAPGATTPVSPATTAPAVPTTAPAATTPAP